MSYLHDTPDSFEERPLVMKTETRKRLTLVGATVALFGLLGSYAVSMF